MNKSTVSRLFFAACVAGTALAGLLFLLSSPSQAQGFYPHVALAPSAAPDLLVYKVLNSGAPLAGGKIEYRIAYANQGDAAAQNTFITDTLPVSTSFVSWYGYASNPSVVLTQTVMATIMGNQVMWNLGTVPAGQYGNIYTMIQITDTAQVGNVLTNVVQILSTDTEITTTSNLYTHTTTVVTPTQDMSIYKWASGTLLPGNQIQYILSYSNQGNSPAHDITITDTLPVSVTYLGHSAPGFTTVVTGSTVVVTQALVNAGASGLITLTVRITDSAQAGQVMTNVAQISTSDVDITPTNNIFTRAVTISSPTQDMSVYKWVSSGTPLPGNQIQYQINYNNLGNSPAHNIRITDTLPANVTYVTHTAPGFATVITGSTVIVTQALVNAGASGLITLTVRITDSAQAGQVLTNVVQVSTSDADINPGNNTYTRTTTILAPTRDMSIYKWAGGTPLPGSQIYYQINYSNMGNSPAHNVRITDTLPDSVTYLGHSASGFTTVITGSTLVLTQAVVNAGTSGTIYVSVRITDTAQPGRLLTNIAQISTSDVETDTTNNTYVRTTLIAAPPVTTTINPSGGSFIVYTDTRGLTTTLDVPADAVSGTTDLRFTPVFSLAGPISPELGLAGNAFDFDAYLNSVYVDGFTFSETVTMTIPYEPDDLIGIETNTLALYRWVPPVWQLVGVRNGEGQTLDTVHNLLIVQLNGLSHFAKMGISHKIYLPLVLRSG
jgi:uncharacterized repeat protein (TIGR01451 family)